MDNATAFALNREIAHALGFAIRILDAGDPTIEDDGYPRRDPTWVIDLPLGRTIAHGNDGPIASLPTGDPTLYFKSVAESSMLGLELGLRDWARDYESAFSLIADGTPEAEDIAIKIRREWDFFHEKREFRVEVWVDDLAVPTGIGFGDELPEAVARAGLAHRRWLLRESL